jgi:hypothetical protein
MAKCIKKGNTIKRVSNEQAYREVKQGWSFCPRSEWKKTSPIHKKNRERENPKKGDSSDDS